MTQLCSGILSVKEGVAREKIVHIIILTCATWHRLTPSSVRITNGVFGRVWIKIIALDAVEFAHRREEVISVAGNLAKLQVARALALNSLRYKITHK